MISKARLRHLKTSPQKARLVVDKIRDRGVEDALSLLRNHKRAVAHDLEKLLRSAVANASVGEQRVRETYGTSAAASLIMGTDQRINKLSVSPVLV